MSSTRSTRRVVRPCDADDPSVGRPGGRRRRIRSPVALRRTVLARRARSDCDVARASSRRRTRAVTGRATTSTSTRSPAQWASVTPRTAPHRSVAPCSAASCSVSPIRSRTASPYGDGCRRSACAISSECRRTSSPLTSSGSSQRFGSDELTRAHRLATTMLDLGDDTCRHRTPPDRARCQRCRGLRGRRQRLPTHAGGVKLVARSISRRVPKPVAPLA